MKTNKTCIILDVDNTLVHTINKSETSHLKNVQNINMIKMGELSICTRPYLYDFLNIICNNPKYDIGLWSFGTIYYIKIIKIK